MAHKNRFFFPTFSGGIPISRIFQEAETEAKSRKEESDKAGFRNKFSKGRRGGTVESFWGEKAGEFSPEYVYLYIYRYINLFHWFNVQPVDFFGV